MTPDQEIARIKKLVSAAKSVVSGQVGVTIGSYCISNKLQFLGEQWKWRYPIFDKYRSELPIEMPVGSERLVWNLDRVLELDPFLAKIEYKYRSKILKTCVDIIKNHAR